MRNCRNRKVNRRAILCSRKQGSAPASNTIKKANRDERYASLLANMQNNSGPKPAVKSAKLAEPSADAIYNAYPNQGPGFYRYVERNSSRRKYNLGRSRRIAAN
jgi:hypothetical protein